MGLVAGSVTPQRTRAADTGVPTAKSTVYSSSGLSPRQSSFVIDIEVNVADLLVILLENPTEHFYP